MLFTSHTLQLICHEALMMIHNVCRSLGKRSKPGLDCNLSEVVVVWRCILEKASKIPWKLDWKLNCCGETSRFILDVITNRWALRENLVHTDFFWYSFSVIGMNSLLVSGSWVRLAYLNVFHYLSVAPKQTLSQLNVDFDEIFFGGEAGDPFDHITYSMGVSTSLAAAPERFLKTPISQGVSLFPVSEMMLLNSKT